MIFSGYLENQQLHKASNEFCNTSRHLAKEKQGLKYGNRMIDTSLGLVNIVREYFLFQSRINEFLRLCPQSPLIIELIDTNDTLLRLDKLLKTVKDHLGKIDKIPSDNPKKRKHEIDDDDEFVVSQTNTSTPETVMSSVKRLKSSLTTPFLTLSTNKEETVKTVDKVLKNHINFSSTDTSGKEDDDVEEQVKLPPAASQVLKANPEVRIYYATVVFTFLFIPRF